MGIADAPLSANGLHNSGLDQSLGTAKAFVQGTIMLKRFMIADRKDPAFVHHDNPIGIDDSRQTMGHNDGGSSLQQAVERILRVRVEVFERIGIL